MTTALFITNLWVCTANKEILKGINLTIQPGSIHALMGPNGSGKSTLAATLMGHPSYEVRSGDIILFGDSLLEIPTEQRAQRGLFLAFQQPVEIPGVSIRLLFKEAYQALTGSHISVRDFSLLLDEAMRMVSLDPAWADRSINEGFSGGEKKRLEMAQILLFKPKMVILDEIDSGLDVDALQEVACALKSVKDACPQTAFLIVTHYNRIFNYIIPDHVHIICQGTIAASGDALLAQSIEKEGYERYQSL